MSNVNAWFQLIEAVVLPMTHKERFEALGIQPPKGTILDHVFCQCLKKEITLSMSM